MVFVYYLLMCHRHFDKSCKYKRSLYALYFLYRFITTTRQTGGFYVVNVLVGTHIR
jgi:hypothetical protein